MKALVLLLVALLFATPAFAQKSRRGNDARPAATPAPETGFNAFRIVRTRNIFDPNRRPPPPPEAANKAAVQEPKPVRTSLLVLTGTMVTDQKRLAFFHGSSSDFNRVVTVDDKLGDLVVAGISASHVDLKRGDEAIVLPVGKQLSLGAAKPTIEAAPAPVDAPRPSSSPDTPAASAAPSAQVGPPVDRAELTRRMMERRNKESK